MKILSEDDINDIKYKITNELVKEGIIEDCTDTDNEVEVNTENVIENVLTDFLKKVEVTTTYDEKLNNLRKIVSVENEQELRDMLEIIESADKDTLADHIEGVQISEIFEYTFTIGDLVDHITN